MEALVRKVVQECLSRSESDRTINPPVIPASVLAGDDPEISGPSRHSHSLSGASDSEAEVDDPGVDFDFTMVPQLVKAVKEALRWEEPVEAPSKQRKYFKHLKKEWPNFPFLGELSEIISDEWGGVERKNLLISKIAKMYPFKSEHVKHLIRLLSLMQY